MRRTPSYLKGLAETRARLAGDIERYERTMHDLQVLIDKVRLEKDACDTLIKKFDQRLDPGLIEPIRQHNPRYGTRGKLKAVILSCVQKAYPSEVTTPEIGLTLQVVFGLDFATWQETEEWTANSVRPQLRKLVKEGLVERLHEATAGAGVGRWRLADKSGS
jgi:hypothetical protein